jgi:hypothetical protein
LSRACRSRPAQIAGSADRGTTDSRSPVNRRRQAIPHLLSYSHVSHFLRALGKAVVVPTRVKGRFVLLTIGRFLIGGASLFRSVELFMTDSASPLLPTVFLLVGMMFLWWGVVGARALFSSDPLQRGLIAAEIAEVDRRAPSGLKPLWVALGTILAMFLIWVLIAGWLGAT